MEARPKIKLALTETDKVFEMIGWLSLLALWGLTVINYANLPDTIPTHFNGAGEVDGFGEKTTLLLLPFIATILFIGLTVLNKFPHLFNYPVSITKDNALRQYAIATSVFRYLKLIVVIIFGIIVFQTIQNANGQADGLGTWFMPVTQVLIFVPTIYFALKVFKKK